MAVGSQAWRAQTPQATRLLTRQYSTAMGLLPMRLLSVPGVLAYSAAENCGRNHSRGMEQFGSALIRVRHGFRVVIMTGLRNSSQQLGQSAHLLSHQHRCFTAAAKPCTVHPS